MGEQCHRLAGFERHGCAVALHPRRAQQADVEAHSVTIGPCCPVSSRFRVRNANRTPVGDAVAMTSTAVRPVAPWMARLPWLMLAVTTASRRRDGPALARARTALRHGLLRTAGPRARDHRRVRRRPSAEQPDRLDLLHTRVLWRLARVLGRRAGLSRRPHVHRGQWIIQWWSGSSMALPTPWYSCSSRPAACCRRAGAGSTGCWLQRSCSRAPGQSLTTRNPDNPLPVDSPVVETMLNIGLALLLAGIAASMAALVVRFRRATGSSTCSSSSSCSRRP